MNKAMVAAIIGLSIFLCRLEPAHAVMAEAFKGFFAVSTRELEELKKDALVKVFEYDYKTCYDKTLAIVKKMPDTNIYAESKDLIAIYCTCLNSTPVGIFFESVDPTHTRVLLSSASSRAKDWVASNVFSEKVQKSPEKIKIK